MQGTDATPPVQPKGTLLILPPCESLRIQVDDGNGPVDYTGLSRTLKRLDMVNMIHTNSTEHIADQQAVEEFRHQWHVYSKLVDHDFFSHRDVAATLNRRLQKIDRPFRFLDLACGDSRTAVAALRGTAVGSYRGIDLSTPALDLARHAVESLPCPLAFKAQRRFRLRVDGRESLE